MAKGSFWSDTFEQALEFGQGTVKQGTQAVKQTFSPIKILEQVTGSSPQASQDKGKEMLEKGQIDGQNHTPLNLEELQKKYQDQDKQKMEGLRSRLFQLVKSGEEKAVGEIKKEEEERKRKLSQEEQEKRRRAEEIKRQQEVAPAPQGKIRKSIFSHKNVAQRQKVEVKPSTGKQ